MNKPSFKLAALLLLTFFFTKLNGQCPDPVHPDYNALVALYNASEGPNWVTDWETPINNSNCDPCTWESVECTNGRVTGLNVTFGANILFIGDFTEVNIPDEFVELTELRNMIFWDSRLQSVSPTFKNMPNLKSIVFNRDLGSLTIEELNLPSGLKRLRTNLSNFTGTLASLGSLQLDTLWLNRLDDVQDTVIPQEIVEMSTLIRADFNACGFTGPLDPGWADLPNLTFLGLRYNNFTGTIPEEWCNFSEDMEFINLGDNNLEGFLPACWGNNYSSPTFAFDVRNNNFTGCYPSSLYNLNLSPVNVSGPLIFGDIIAPFSVVGNNFDVPWVDFVLNGDGVCGPEICDGIDNDNNFLVDDNIGSLWFADNDGDGFGTTSETQLACSQPPGFVSNTSDCDDSNPNIFFGNPEICDGLDNNCDGLIDEGLSFLTWYLDNDGDGFGDDSNTINDCIAPFGYVTIGGDCDDNNATINSDAAEICDGIDNNCDGQIDEGLSILTWYLDNDGDGFGDDANSIDNCSAPQGYVPLSGDCDDNDADINSDVAEICDGIDNNCDGQIDEGFDSDADGIGDCLDNCPDVSNPDQIDSDGDGQGDACSIIGNCENIPDNSTQYEYIDRVQTVGFDNQSGDDGGYADYTDLTAIIYQDASTPFLLTPGYNGTAYPEFWSIWIDWNDDNDFDDAGEIVFESNGAEFGTVEANIQAPAGVGGERVMRVQMGYFTPSTDPCETTGGEGETEDYSIYVLPCYSNAGTTFYEYIDEVTFGNQTSTTGNNGGWFFDTENPFVMNINESVPVSLVPGFNATAYDEFWRVWIDLNFDGAFSNDEIVFEDNGTGTVTGSFDFDPNQQLGITSMKIIMKWNSYQQEPCNGFAYGEVEDYVVHLVQTNSLSSSSDIDIEKFRNREVAPVASQAQVNSRLNLADGNGLDLGLNVYPNPGEGIFIIDVEGDLKEILNYEVYDAAGRILFDGSINSNRASIDLRSVENGNYLLKVYNSKGVKVLNLIKI